MADIAAASSTTAPAAGAAAAGSATSVARKRRPQIAILGSADEGTRAYELAIEVGRFVGGKKWTLVASDGSAVTRAAAEAAQKAGALVIALSTDDNIGSEACPCDVLIPTGMGDARNLVHALAGDVVVVIGGRAGTMSEVCLAWMHKRPLLLLAGSGGWSDRLLVAPPDERASAPILPWSSIVELEAALASLGLA